MGKRHPNTHGYTPGGAVGHRKGGSLAGAIRAAKMLDAQKIEWPRSDPVALAAFDERTKVCTMNCTKVAADPRSYKELKFQCDDCCEDHKIPFKERKAKIMAEVQQVDRFVPDYGHQCEVCGADHVVTAQKDGRTVYQGSMCGVCTWGESAMRDPEEWNK